MSGDLTVGPITEQERAAFEHELEEARRAWTERVWDVDLVCVIDVIGDTATVQGRCNFARAVIQQIQTTLSQYALPDKLRVGILTYGDRIHFQKDATSPITRYGLSDANTALKHLGQVQAQEKREFDFEAALEDALAAVVEVDSFAWTCSGQRVLVTIGSRPPHPFTPYKTWKQIPSPTRHNWKKLVEQIRQNGIQSICVVCPIWPKNAMFPGHAEEYADHCWREIGYTRRFDYEKVSPADVTNLVLTFFKKVAKRY
jgi:hypothetical protein